MKVLPAFVPQCPQRWAQIAKHVASQSAATAWFLERLDMTDKCQMSTLDIYITLHHRPYSQNPTIFPFKLLELCKPRFDPEVLSKNNKHVLHIAFKLKFDLSMNLAPNMSSNSCFQLRSLSGCYITIGCQN